MVRKIDSFPALVVLIAVAACGDNSPPTTHDAAPTPQRCDVLDLFDLSERPYCRSAINLAIHYGGDVIVTQDDVDGYYELTAKVYMAVRLTRLASAATATDSIFELPVYSNYDPVLSAWPSGTLATGDAIVDALFYDNGMTAVDYWLPPEPGETPSFLTRFPRPVSFDAMDLSITQVPMTQLADTLYRPYNDISIVVFGDRTVLEMVGGWGDCFPGCTYFHAWQATVFDDGRTEVIDAGGDPIPAELVAIVEGSPDP